MTFDIAAARRVADAMFKQGSDSAFVLYAACDEIERLRVENAELGARLDSDLPPSMREGDFDGPS